MAHSLMEKTYNKCYCMTYIVSILVSEDPEDIKGVGKLAIISFRRHGRQLNIEVDTSRHRNVIITNLRR
jgi:hypothetical protein